MDGKSLPSRRRGAGAWTTSSSSGCGEASLEIVAVDDGSSAPFELHSAAVASKLIHSIEIIQLALISATKGPSPSVWRT
jgi:hypothetical protein